MIADFNPFLRSLEGAGYFQNYLTFGEGNLRSWDWERTTRMLTGKPKAVWQALLCGQAVSRSQLDRFLPKRVLAELLKRGFASNDGGKITFGSNSLISSHGFVFFVDRGSFAAGYFGEESRILMGSTPRLQAGRVLCLNTGTGAEGLVSSAAGPVELAVEADRTMHSYIRTNLELNGLTAKYQVFAPDERSSCAYDLIVARIPGLLEFGGIKFPYLAAGGREPWESLVGRSQQDLSDSGRLVFIGTFYGGKESGLVVKQLTELFKKQGLSASFNMSSKLAMELGVPIFNQTLATAERYSAKPRTELYQTLEKTRESLGYTHAYLVKGIAWKARKGLTSNFLDLTEHYYGTWLT